MALRLATRRFATESLTKVVGSLSFVEKLDSNLYRGANASFVTAKSGVVYGGQIVGQAMMASSQTVSNWLHLHSIQCHFVRQGDPSCSILYFVERLREGKNFCARYVKAVQVGQCIFTARLSYHQHAPCPVEHQTQMQDVPEPEFLPNLADTAPSPLGPVSSCFQQRPILLNKSKVDAYGTPLQFTWVKQNPPLCDMDVNLKQCLTSHLAYNVMFNQALSSLKDERYHVDSAVSLDHCTWFHHYDWDFDDWLLCESGLSLAAVGCGFSHFRMWSRQGRLLVTSLLDCLIGEPAKVLLNEE